MLLVRVFDQVEASIASSAAEGAPCLGISLRNLGLTANQKMLAQQVYRTKATLAAMLILSSENSRRVPTIATLDKEWWYGARMGIWFTLFHFSGLPTTPLHVARAIEADLLLDSQTAGVAAFLFWSVRATERPSTARRFRGGRRQSRRRHT
jgi:hypothetical protein